MTTEKTLVSAPVHAVVTRIRRLVALARCWLIGHDWLTVSVKGGTTGLIYSRRICVRCFDRQMQTSTGRWVKPFMLTQEWEREDFETGSHYECG